MSDPSLIDNPRGAADSDTADDSRRVLSLFSRAPYEPPEPPPQPLEKGTVHKPTIAALQQALELAEKGELGGVAILAFEPGANRVQQWITLPPGDEYLFASLFAAQTDLLKEFYLNIVAVDGEAESHPSDYDEEFE